MTVAHRSGLLVRPAAANAHDPRFSRSTREPHDEVPLAPGRTTYLGVIAVASTIPV